MSDAIEPDVECPNGCANGIPPGVFCTCCGNTGFCSQEKARIRQAAIERIHEQEAYRKFTAEGIASSA